MIAKHIPMRASQKSDFAGLVDYITDSQSKEHRLGLVTITNCETNNLKAAKMEILATQHSNTRATSDKTYHLLISFRAGEQPPLETLKAIEERICAGIGFAGHQRISAIHNDTDNLHIHIAINKIHPKRGTIQEPYKAYKTLGNLCEVLEREYGLQADNHASIKTLSEGRANDMERHAGVQSLVSWIKEECLENMRGATSWAQLKEVLSANGLEIKERGAGFVIEADGIQIKASTIARDLSRPALEARLGAYEGDSKKEGVVKPKKQYQKKPLNRRSDTTELYAKYKDDQASLASKRTAELSRLRREKERVIADAKRSNNLRRKAIGILNTTGINRKFLYSQASESLRSTIKTAQSEYNKKRKKIMDTHQRRTWADWLKDQAVTGNEKALELLRERNSEGLQGNTIQPEKNTQSKTATTAVDNITKKGTVIYRTSAGAIRDDGKKLQISKNATTAGVEAAIKLAMERYGNKLTVNGTAEFKAQVFSVAIKNKLPITFADPGLERLRLNYMEKLNDQSNRQQPSGNERGRLDSGSVGTARQPAATHIDRPGTDAGRRLPGTGLQPGNTKPNVAAIGRKPPPHAKDRLRRLSQLGLVQFTRRSEVLLPGNVHGVVEHQGTQSNNSLRWNAARAGLSADHIRAANKYIKERMDKAAKAFDIPKHSIYNGEVKTAKFAGLRHVDGYPLALLKMDDDSISVLPIDKATAQRLTRVSLNQEVSVTDKGSIKASKGRSR